MINTIDDIVDLVLRGFGDWESLGSVNVTEYGEFLLFCYKSSAQYEDNWNFFERVSRGLIINKRTGEVVARPFDKFFNWDQGGRKAPYTSHIVSVTEKVDGSLGILYRDGRLKVTTKGNPFSPQAKWATKFLENYQLDSLPDELTLLFEMIYPGNRIVVDYGNKEDLVLLAARNRFTGEYLPFYPDVYELGTRYGFSLPKTYVVNNIMELLAKTGEYSPELEGWVIEFSNGDRYKIKTDTYVEMHKMISGLSFKNTLTAVINKEVNYVRDLVPDEFLDEFEGWVSEIESFTNELEEEVNKAYLALPKHTRKEFALEAKMSPLAPFLFCKYDGGNVRDMIYKRAFNDR